MGSIKTQGSKTKTNKRPAHKKVGAQGWADSAFWKGVFWGAGSWHPTAHIGLIVGTVLIFIAGLLFDTQALMQLAWIGCRAGIVWLFQHKAVTLLAVASVGAILWGGLQARPLPVKTKRKTEKSKKAGASRDPSRAVRPAQARRTVGSRRPTATPRV